MQTHSPLWFTPYRGWFSRMCTEPSVTRRLAHRVLIGELVQDWAPTWCEDRRTKQKELKCRVVRTQASVLLLGHLELGQAWQESPVSTSHTDWSLDVAFPWRAEVTCSGVDCSSGAGAGLGSTLQRLQQQCPGPAAVPPQGLGP